MNNQTPIQIKEKPWGKEIWFAHMAGYAGKILEIKAGKRLSLQYHEKKAETQYLLSGVIKMTIGKDKNNLKNIILKAGDKIDIHPYTIHRIEGIEDSKILEVSTDQLQDVVRLEDDYNRPEKGNHEELDTQLSKQQKI